MSVLDDAVSGLLAPGRRWGGRPRRRSRPPAPVQPSRWLAVAMGAVAVQSLTVLAATAGLGYAAMVFGTDDLLFVLGLIVLPLAVTGMGMGLSALAWLARIALRLARRDGNARIDLVVMGIAGLFVGAWTVAMGLVGPGLLVVAPAAVALVVASVPGAWRSADRPVPLEGVGRGC
ncbi:MAG: hypothetical protein ACT4PX_03605 [Actinomycetota bacterium]